MWAESAFTVHGKKQKVSSRETTGRFIILDRNNHTNYDSVHLMELINVVCEGLNFSISDIEGLRCTDNTDNTDKTLTLSVYRDERAEFHYLLNSGGTGACYWITLPANSERWNEKQTLMDCIVENVLDEGNNLASWEFSYYAAVKIAMSMVGYGLIKTKLNKDELVQYIAELPLCRIGVEGAESRK